MDKCTTDPLAPRHLPEGLTEEEIRTMENAAARYEPHALACMLGHAMKEIRRLKSCRARDELRAQSTIGVVNVP